MFITYIKYTLSVLNFYKVAAMYELNWELATKIAVNWYLAEKLAANWELGTPISTLLYGVCAKIFNMNQYILMIYTTTKDTIDRQHTEQGQLQCQLLLAIT